MDTLCPEIIELLDRVRPRNESVCLIAPRLIMLLHCGAMWMLSDGIFRVRMRETGTTAFAGFFAELAGRDPAVQKRIQVGDRAVVFDMQTDRWVEMKESEATEMVRAANYAVAPIPGHSSPKL